MNAVIYIHRPVVYLTVIDCGPIPVVGNATITYWSPMNSTKYQTVVNYTCIDLMWFSRKVFSMPTICQADGHWSRVGTCQRK